MPTRSKLLRLTLVLFTAVGAAACGASHITGTEVPDTDENRAIYDIVMQYRRAIEGRDMDGVLDLVSRDYYENGGTTDRADDDYGYEELRTSVLPRLMANVKQVQYKILLSRIRVDGPHAWADYEFHYTFKYVEGGVEGWQTRNDFNRLDFKREGETWKIVAGL